MNKQPRDWGKVQRLKSPRQVNIRVTNEEMARLETIAEHLGVSKAGYIKSVVFARPIPQSSKRPRAVSADLRQVLGLMGKLGSNANQIARLCNTGTLTDQRDAIAALEGIKAELVTMRAVLLKALDEEP